VHFPYCDRRCPYCDFVLVTPKAVPSRAYTDALLTEWSWRRPIEVDGPLGTLYLGGGTPSLWDPVELARLVARLEADVGFVAGAERTIEANPEQVTEAWLDAVTALGFNRVSLGVQSLDDDALVRLGRAHGRQGAEAALGLLAAARSDGRLQSFSLDLIYGWQGQTLTMWRAELAEVLARWAPPHLSLYALTVEPRTVLGKKVREGLARGPDDGLQAEMMFEARRILRDAGMVHYEVSSWATPGHIAVHNSRYWDMSPWVGLGAGAAGFTGARRYRNQAVIRRYLEAIAADRPLDLEDESSLPNARDLAFDAVMTGLRRLDLGLLWTLALAGHFEAAARREEAAGRLVFEPNADGLRVRLTDEGLRFMDDVLLALLDAEDGV